ncbi:MAG: LamG domain-containing protein [Candidatus Diapherotrites archaeon]|nr:LamG domain-containing protein [Candidatus Diapherotrites archaeon]
MMRLKIMVWVMILIAVAFAADFNITTTTDFDAGTKVNVTTSTDRYEQDEGTIELDFPYAEKDTNLTSYWRFEDNANDETGLGDGTVYGATSIDGWLDRAFLFDGSDDYISIPDKDEYTFTDGTDGNDIPFTVVFWANSSDWSNTGGGLIGIYDVPNSNFEWLVWDAKKYSCLGFGLYSDSTSNRIGRYSDGYPANNEWTMIAVTYDGSKSKTGMHIYFNGTNVDGSTSYTSGTYTGMKNTGKNPEIGRYRGSSTQYFNGTIDEIKIYRRELSQAEIQELYNQGKRYKSSGSWESADISMPSEKVLENTVIEGIVDSNNYIDKIEWLVDGEVKATYDEDITSVTPIEFLSHDLYGDANLVSYWRFEGNANDEKGLNNGTVDGATQTTGMFGNAYYFDGSNDRIYMQDSTSLRLQNFTIAFWMKPAIELDKSGTNQWFFIVDKMGGSTNGYHISYHKGSSYGQLSYRLGDGSSQNAVVFSTTFHKDTWYHIAYTYDHSNRIIYINGEEAHRTPTTFNPTYDTKAVTIGRRTEYAQYYFNGTIDDFVIFDRALSEDEIKKIYAYGKKTITDDDLTSGTFNDVSGNFSIKLYLNGSGTDTPIVEEIYGDYKETHAPIITSIDVFPDNPSIYDELNCSWVITDIDPGDTLRANVTWFGDGSQRTTWDVTGISCTNGTTCYTTITVNETNTSESWTCMVTAYDYYGNTDQENATENVVPYIYIYYTDNSYDRFLFDYKDWQTGTGEVETFASSCDGSLGTGKLFMGYIDVNSSKILDRIVFTDAYGGNIPQITAITIKKVPGTSP